MELLINNAIFNSSSFNATGLMEMAFRFLFNLAMVWVIVHFFYYPKGRRRDFYFTFILLSVSIFMLIYLMDGSNLQIGAALGLFAVFGIIRYRTESVPIREMTYLFFLVALSVLNGTNNELSLTELISANLLLLLTAWTTEHILGNNQLSSKYVKYDRIDLIVPERYDELKADLETRIGIKVVKVEVGGIDFLTDMAMLQVYYHDKGAAAKAVDQIHKLPHA